MSAASRLYAGLCELAVGSRPECAFVSTDEVAVCACRCCTLVSVLVAPSSVMFRSDDWSTLDEDGYFMVVGDVATVWPPSGESFKSERCRSVEMGCHGCRGVRGHGVGECVVDGYGVGGKSGVGGTYVVVFKLAVEYVCGVKIFVVLLADDMLTG